MPRPRAAAGNEAQANGEQAMNQRTYALVSGTIFGIVAGFHLLRLVNGWPLALGPWSAPMWVSGFGTLGPTLLCVWAFRLSSRKRV